MATSHDTAPDRRMIQEGPSIKIENKIFKVNFLSHVRSGPDRHSRGHRAGTHLAVALALPAA
jgi:hypothetical protein